MQSTLHDVAKTLARDNFSHPRLFAAEIPGHDGITPYEIAAELEPSERVRRLVNSQDIASSRIEYLPASRVEEEDASEYSSVRLVVRLAPNESGVVERHGYAIEQEYDSVIDQRIFSLESSTEFALGGRRLLHEGQNPDQERLTNDQILELLAEETMMQRRPTKEESELILGVFEAYVSSRRDPSPVE